VDEGKSLPAAPGGSGPATSRNFSVTLEVQFLNLPPKGQLAAMLRFSSPDVSQVKKANLSVSTLNLASFKPIKLLDDILLQL
jgi:hypothetical protein